MMKNGTELETFVEHVYSMLLRNEKLKNTTITKNQVITGRSGAKHEFDVYYEMEIAHITHGVAIECKQHNRAITKGMVQEFKAKLDDCNNIIGFMVTSIGYQSGARDFAEYYGIKVLTTSELPTVIDLLSMHIACLLPDESTDGDPFWIIMETSKGVNTGTYASVRNDAIPLFLSKHAAEKAMKHLGLTNCNSYGVSRQHLKGICAISEVFGIDLLICPLLSAQMFVNNQQDLLFFSCTPKAILDDYEIQ